MTFVSKQVSGHISISINKALCVRTYFMDPKNKYKKIKM